MSHLPASAPATTGEAFAHINTVTAPTLDDLKLMVYLEASGQTAYYELAKASDSAEVRALLEANGREEMAHAHRVAKAIELISGEPFPVPAAAENPYAKPSGRTTIDRALMQYLVTAENNGNDLYESWAKATANPEAAALFRQNGKEEIRHGERAAQAMALLPA